QGHIVEVAASTGLRTTHSSASFATEAFSLRVRSIWHGNPLIQFVKSVRLRKSPQSQEVPEPGWLRWAQAGMFLSLGVIAAIALFGGLQFTFGIDGWNWYRSAFRGKDWTARIVYAVTSVVLTTAWRKIGWHVSSSALRNSSITDRSIVWIQVVVAAFNGFIWNEVIDRMKI